MSEQGEKGGPSPTPSVGTGGPSGTMSVQAARRRELSSDSPEQSRAFMAFMNSIPASEQRLVELFELVCGPTLHALTPFLKAVISTEDPARKDADSDMKLKDALDKNKYLISHSNFQDYEMNALKNSEYKLSALDVPVMSKLIIILSIANFKDVEKWLVSLLSDKKDGDEKARINEEKAIIQEAIMKETKSLSKRFNADDQRKVWEIRLYSELKSDSTSVKNLIQYAYLRRGKTPTDLTYENDLEVLKVHLLRAITDTDNVEANVADEDVNQKLQLFLPTLLEVYGSAKQRNQVSVDKDFVKEMEKQPQKLLRAKWNKEDEVSKVVCWHFSEKFTNEKGYHIKDPLNRSFLKFVKEKTSIVKPEALSRIEDWRHAVLLIDACRLYRNSVCHLGKAGLDQKNFEVRKSMIRETLKMLDWKEEEYIEKLEEKDKATSYVAYYIHNIVGTLTKKTKRRADRESKDQEMEEPATIAALSQSPTDVKSVLKTFKTLGETFNRTSKYQPALDVNMAVLLHYERMYNAEKNSKENLCMVVLCRKNVALSHWNLGNYKRAQETFEEAMRLINTELGSPSSDQCLATKCLCLPDYASLLIDLGNYKDATTILKEAKLPKYKKARKRLIKKNLLKADHARSWKLYLSSGNLHFSLEEYDQAVAEYAEALNLLDEQSDDYQYIRCNIACVKLKQEQVTEALDEYRKILSYLETKDDDTFNSSETIDVRNNLAVALHELRQYEDALALHNEVFEQRQMIYGTEHPTTMQSISNIGCVLFELRSYDEALECHEKVFAYWCEVADEKNAKAMIERACIARCYSKLGRYDEASNEFKEVIKDSTKVLGEDHPDTKKAKAYYREHLEYVKSMDPTNKEVKQI